MGTSRSDEQRRRPRLAGWFRPRPDGGFRWGRASILFVVVILVVCFLARGPILVAFGTFLVVDETPPRADAILVLNGDLHTRPFHAAELYLAGVAPRVWLARAEESAATRAGLLPTDTVVALRILSDQGVPDEAIEVFANEPATSTYDEVVALRDHLADHQYARVVVVTSPFHTRRTRYIASRVIDTETATIFTAPAPFDDFDTSNWWTKEQGLITVQNEYAKLLYYWWKY